jgi:hypothetical protein
MKSQRIELRVDPVFRKQLDELAANMRCPVSSVMRQLVIAEHKRRFPAGTTMTPAASAPATQAIGAGDLQWVRDIVAAKPGTATLTLRELAAVMSGRRPGAMMVVQPAQLAQPNSGLQDLKKENSIDHRP